MREAVRSLMPAARNKRCRQARPLTWWVDSARARATGDGNAHQCRTPVALGTQCSPTKVKGGIARATGSTKLWRSNASWWQVMLAHFW
ncbi:MAG TPA: hypothetical protein VFB60_26550 [Ktedonobacteraceae bacterium]|nr:hypothetical protein [Ktedonobacteraceae bacterium]